MQNAGYTLFKNALTCTVQFKRMYFVLSKVLYFLILPFLWAFGLLVYALITKNQRRRYRLMLASVIVLYLFGSRPLFTLFANAWDAPRYQASSKKYSCVIVLGGFVSQDKNGKGFLNESKDRFTQGTRMLDSGVASHLLMTGGNGSLNPDGFSEGEYVRGLLKNMHYPDSLILIEGKSRNTFENASLSHNILKKTNLKPPYLLVTSAFHMRRALLVFKKEGLDVVPYPADYKTISHPFSVDDVLPMTEIYGNWNLYIKELIGYTVTALK